MENTAQGQPAALRTHFMLLGIVVVWACFRAYPDLTSNAIDPYDGSLFAANGGLFLSALQEFRQFVASPVDWLYTYYNQYPALAVRRHPPLFGITEAVAYMFTGVSVFGAKLTNFLYALLLAGGVYAVSYRIWRDALLGFATALLVMSTPQIIWLGTAVRLDVPSIALAVWAMFHYLGYLQSGRRSSAVWFAVFSVLSLFTYQLTFFIIIGACLHLLVLRRTALFRDRTFYVVVGIFAVFLLPLAVEQIIVAKDNFTAAGGGEVEEWKRFHPVENRLSLEFFLFYPKEWLASYPVQTLGMCFWAIIAMRRGIDRSAGLLLLGATLGFLFFTWSRGKDVRYMAYVVVPMSVLAANAFAEAIKAGLDRAKANARSIMACGGIALLGLAQAHFVVTPYVHVHGMDEAVKSILGKSRDARILYVGPRDGGFVFYLRANDLRREARVHRATVQLKKPEDLPAYIAKHRINVLIWEEGDARSGEDGMNAYRSKLKQYAAERPEYKRLEVTPLRYLSLRGEKRIDLAVRMTSGA